MKIIHSALDEGITLMDTAPSYGFGHCEQIIGKALKGRRIKQLLQQMWSLVAGSGDLKWAERWQRPIYKFAPDTIRIEVENSLRYLNTDYLDLLQVHKLNTPEETPIEETGLFNGTQKEVKFEQ